MPDIGCLGEALIDFLAEPVRGPRVVRRFSENAGGAPANTAVAAVRLGVSASFLGALARDAFGDFLCDELSTAGVGTEGVQRPDDGRTALAFVFLDGSGERSFLFYGERAAHLLYRPELLSDGFLPSLRVLHLGSTNTLTDERSAAATHTCVKRARALGVRTSFDINLRPPLWSDPRSMRPRIDRILPDIAILKMSREEFLWMNETAPGPWLEEWFAAAGRIALVTDGPRPIEYITRRGRGRVPAWTVEVHDTTAAGDAFAAGFLVRAVEAARGGADLEAWLEEEDALVPALRFAAAAGALAAARPGSFAAMPWREEVDIFLESRRASPA